MRLKNVSRWRTRANRPTNTPAENIVKYLVEGAKSGSLGGPGVLHSFADANATAANPRDAEPGDAVEISDPLFDR
jgi:hypothetical protein